MTRWQKELDVLLREVKEVNHLIAGSNTKVREELKQEQRELIMEVNARLKRINLKNPNTKYGKENE